MPDTAIPELIALEIVDRLKKIKTANGYIFDVAGVDRPTRNANEWSPKNLSIAVVQGDELPNDEATYEGNPPAMGYDVLFHIHAFVRESDKSTEPHNTTENAMVAAIRKAIVDDGVDWYTFDGNAIIADWSANSPYLSPEGDHAGVTLTLKVTYRISETNPSESRA